MSKEAPDFCYPLAEKLQNFFGVFLQFQIGVDNIIGSTEIAARLQPLMKQAGIGNTLVNRTDKNGRSYQETIQADITLLQQNARYLAERCGSDAVMTHAMFGDSWTETDEQAYLHLLSDEYAVARYLRLRRWSPLAPTPLPDAGEDYLTGFSHIPTRHVVRVDNPANRTNELTLSVPYALKSYWTSKADK